MSTGIKKITFPDAEKEAAFECIAFMAAGKPVPESRGNHAGGMRPELEHQDLLNMYQWLNRSPHRIVEEKEIEQFIEMAPLWRKRLILQDGTVNLFLARPATITSPYSTEISGHPFVVLHHQEGITAAALREAITLELKLAYEVEPADQTVGITGLFSEKEHKAVVRLLTTNTKTVAEWMKISESTVRTHTQRTSKNWG